MDRRRRSSRSETADERLDRLIAMEQHARSLPPHGRDQPELRRLKAVPESAEISGAGSSGTAAADGRRAQQEGGAAAGNGDVPRPAHLPLDLDVGRQEPTGMLAPLFQDLSLGRRGGDERALRSDSGHLGRSGEVRGQDQRGRGLMTEGAGLGSNQVNPFWSPQVKREVSALDGGRQMEALQPRSLQPAMSAVGDGRMDISEEELERLRQLMREAEENLKAEIRKLRGEHGADSRSYHSASSSEPGNGGPYAGQGDRSGGVQGMTPDGGVRPAMSTPVPGDRNALVKVHNMFKGHKVWLLRRACSWFAWWWRRL
eukprot:s3183_g4.t1